MRRRVAAMPVLLALLLAAVATLATADTAAGKATDPDRIDASERASGWKACKNLPPFHWKLTVKVIGCRRARRFAHRAHDKFCRRIDCSRYGIGESVRGRVGFRGYGCRIMHYHEGFTARCTKGQRAFYLSYGL